MGCMSSNMFKYSDNSSISRESFLFQSKIGEGGFGKVVVAMCRKNKDWYAVKDINKYDLLKHKTGISMLKNELAALKLVNHPFIIGLHFAFQDK